MSRELPLTSWITDISLKALSSSGYYHHSIIDRITANSFFSKYFSSDCALGHCSAAGGNWLQLFDNVPHS